ncbi:hypothetical protein H072_275 [Dactylellina haptotyla CBS 200.50]|uniref:Uncharacterized protein n=1 Tax=Dactylellina haptotyla (strain CBS 200.50) TaxID=1284197 RepID=S8ASB1_DACHA|nr:hypothetical protein H072_275 [Dactylellina haptotyla CBS 200.50]
MSSYGDSEHNSGGSRAPTSLPPAYCANPDFAKHKIGQSPFIDLTDLPSNSSILYYQTPYNLSQENLESISFGYPVEGPHFGSTKHRNAGTKDYDDRAPYTQDEKGTIISGSSDEGTNYKYNSTLKNELTWRKTPTQFSKSVQDSLPNKDVPYSEKENGEAWSPEALAELMECALTIYQWARSEPLAPAPLETVEPHSIRGTFIAAVKELQSLDTPSRAQLINMLSGSEVSSTLRRRATSDYPLSEKFLNPKVPTRSLALRRARGVMRQGKVLNFPKPGGKAISHSLSALTIDKGTGQATPKTTAKMSKHERNLRRATDDTLINDEDYDEFMEDFAALSMSAERLSNQRYGSFGMMAVEETPREEKPEPSDFEMSTPSTERQSDEKPEVASVESETPESQDDKNIQNDNLPSLEDQRKVYHRDIDQHAVDLANFEEDVVSKVIDVELESAAKLKAVLVQFLLIVLPSANARLKAWNSCQASGLRDIAWISKIRPGKTTEYSGQRSRAGDVTGYHACGSSSNISGFSNSGGDRHNPSRKHSRGGDKEDNNDRDGSEPPRKKRTFKSVEDLSKNLACPFAKGQKEAYPNCLFINRKSLPGIREHLKRNHFNGNNPVQITQARTWAQIFLYCNPDWPVATRPIPSPNYDPFEVYLHSHGLSSHHARNSSEATSNGSSQPLTDETPSLSPGYSEPGTHNIDEQLAESYPEQPPNIPEIPSKSLLRSQAAKHSNNNNGNPSMDAAVSRHLLQQLSTGNIRGISPLQINAARSELQQIPNTDFQHCIQDNLGINTSEIALEDLFGDLFTSVEVQSHQLEGNSLWCPLPEQSPISASSAASSASLSVSPPETSISSAPPLHLTPQDAAIKPFHPDQLSSLDLDIDIDIFSGEGNKTPITASTKSITGSLLDDNKKKYLLRVARNPAVSCSTESSRHKKFFFDDVNEFRNGFESWMKSQFFDPLFCWDSFELENPQRKAVLSSKEDVIDELEFVWDTWRTDRVGFLLVPKNIDVA